MSILYYCIIWYVLGIIGCFLGILTDIKKGQDFTVSDLIISIFVSLLGLLTFILGAGYYLSSSNFTSIVLVEGDKRS